MPGATNVLADALSCVYSDEPRGTVRAVSEYVNAEEEHTPSAVLLNLATTPLHTGKAIFLGTTRSEEIRRAAARQAFPNAKKVLLKVREPMQALEGRSRDTPTSSKSNTTKDAEADIKMTDLLEEQPTLLDVAAMSDPVVNIHRSLMGQYTGDLFFEQILAQPRNYKNFEVSNGLVFLRDNRQRTLCIPDIKIGKQRVREILISHAHSILAHLGPLKTISYLHDNVWWKGLNSDVEEFCRSCTVCQTTKLTNHAPYGLLDTLQVPMYPWETIGIDFVGPLPECKTLLGTYDMILVIIDHLTSMVHLVPTKQTYRARDIAEILYDHVYQLHGMPAHIVSNQDSLFTSTFWKRLHELTGTELHMSSAFHPQTDSATERANCTITQMLRHCVSLNQRDWAPKLPAIEFALNTARSETTGFALFFLNYGRLPWSMIWNDDSEYPGVRVFA